MTIALAALDAHAPGRLIDRYQRATVYPGLRYGINSLDRPAVKRGAQHAREFLQTD